MISKMTGRILPIAKEWQNRPLDRKYAVVFSLKQDGAWVANYDRGWEMEPATEAAKAAFAILMHEYN